MPMVEELLILNVYWLDLFSLQSYSLFRPKAHQQLNSMWHETRVEDIKQKVNMCSEVKLTMGTKHLYFTVLLNTE